jgi:hypothetical protein
MSRNHVNYGKNNDDVDVTKFYIIQHPTPLSSLSDDDIDDGWRDQSKWRNQAKQLQARRWRKLRHQTI